MNRPYEVLAMAEETAHNSDDPHVQVGCILEDIYTGDLIKESNRWFYPPYHMDHRLECIDHAESVAFDKIPHTEKRSWFGSPKRTHSMYYAYVTHPCCADCASLLSPYLKRVYYLKRNSRWLYDTSSKWYTSAMSGVIHFLEDGVKVYMVDHESVDELTSANLVDWVAS